MGGKMYLGNQMVTPVIVDLSLEFQDIQGNPYDNEALKNALDDKQDLLQSGTNIKTINNESLLGNGNINITMPTVDQVYDGTSENAQSGKALQPELASKVEYAMMIVDYEESQEGKCQNCILEHVK